MQSSPGKFITIEGVEGVGKSTNIAFIRDFLIARGIEHIVTREPGGTPVAEEIRRLLLDKHEESIDPVAELLLVFAARAQHLERTIKPALSRGLWVLCDRFTDATYAYQGGGRHIDPARIQILEKFVHENLQPDLTLILDLDPALGLSRAASRGSLDRFESEKIQFFHDVRAVYHRRAQLFPARCTVVDASLTLAEVQEQIRQRLEQFCRQTAI